MQLFTTMMHLMYKNQFTFIHKQNSTLMKRIIYILTITLIAGISFSSCQRKAITQEEIDEFSSQINEKLIEINNNKDSVTIKIDSTNTDTTITVNENKSQKNEITIIQGQGDSQSPAIVLIVFIAVVTPFACVVLIIFFIIRAITSRQREQNKLIEKAIENNYPLPSDFFTPAQKVRSRLQSSLVWLAWGIGIFGALFILAPNDSIYAIGLIPMFVGIAKLIAYFVEDRKSNDL